VPPVQTCFLLVFLRLFTLIVSLCLFHSTYAVGPPYWLTDFSTHIILLAWLPSDRPHVMSQPRLRLPSHIAPHQLSSPAASSPQDHSPTASGSAVWPSKVSPHMTPLPPLSCSRSPLSLSSQSPHCRARSITPPPQSNAPLSCYGGTSRTQQPWEHKQLQYMCTA